MTRSNRKLRFGVTLVELMVIMSASTAVMTTTVVLLHRVMRATSDSRQFLDEERVFLRLSRQFRRDVHQGTTFAIMPGSLHSSEPLVRLTTDDGVVVQYVREERCLARTAVDASGRSTREEFALTPKIDLSVRALDRPRRLRLSAEQSTTAPNVSTTALSVDAVLRGQRSSLSAAE